MKDNQEQKTSIVSISKRQEVVDGCFGTPTFLIEIKKPGRFEIGYYTDNLILNREDFLKLKKALNEYFPE